MKAHSSYFRQKNSKQGLALSTAMAICIVLALLVAVLVSVASLNITTTQSTVSQREAYIQAKSALAFVESYYTNHSDQIPGNEGGATTGEGLVVFNSSTISDGASVYITKVDSTDIIDSGTVAGYKASAVDTYVEVTNTASILDLTAYCKYGNGNAYKLSKEFKFRNGDEVKPNSFTGNIIYKPTSDTRYLRIHVRTSPAFGDQPFLYAWYTTVNKAEGAKGTSSIVNKMSEDTNYATVSNGVWDSTLGPAGACAMTYEGNMWYVTEMQFSKEQTVNFINAIITKQGATRSTNDQQSWEFFGIPVPDENTTGKANGLDVYITLNQSKLLDMRNDGSKDEFTEYFEEKYSANMNNFVKFCSKYYTVYTKKDTATVHYRKANVYDNSVGISGFSYEGYGWWRNTSNNFNDSVSIGGNVISYGDSRGTIVSQNEFGKEVVRELFVVEAEDGSVYVCGSESEANNWLFSKGDLKAGDYITVNVKANEQPVDGLINTKISYSTEWIEEGGEMPEAPDSGSNATVSANGSEELEFIKLAKTDVQSKGDAFEYAVIGWMNNFGRDANDNPATYDNVRGDMLEPNGGYSYTRTYTGLAQGSYSFKIIEMQRNSGLIVDGDFNGWEYAYGNGGGDYVVNVSKDGNNIVINFDRSTNTIDAYEVDPNGGGGSANDYVIAGWMNDFARSKNGLTSAEGVYELTDEMTYSGGAWTYTTGILESGRDYTFKVLEKLAQSGSIQAMGGWDAGHAYGGSGSNSDADGNFLFRMEHDISGNVIKYVANISFDVSNRAINVVLTVVGSSADDNYYLVGTFNNWANNHQYDIVKAYPLTLTGTDNAGHNVYSFVLSDPLESGGPYEFKVVSSSGQTDGSAINYDESWGAPNAQGITKGSDKAAFSFTLAQKSNIEIQFTYDNEYSVITYTPTVYDPDNQVGSVYVGFHNDKLTNINDGTTTPFTAWSQVYITYNHTRCFKLDMSSTNVWGQVPEDAQNVYFSNMPLEDFGKPGYEYTEDIENSKFATITNPIFFPISSTTNSNGVLWSVGDTEEYRTWTSKIKSIHETNVSMAYSGGITSSGYASPQNNYYDAPIVKVLLMLVTGSPNSSTKYAFSAYPYSNYTLPDGGKVSFNNSNKVTYQGETYYYAKQGLWGYSFLMIQSSNGSKGGYLLENHLALISGTWGGVKTRMDNRGGGVFTSDAKYYDGSDSLFNYSGYTPTWYTYKIPVSSELTIEKVTGVTSGSASFIDNSSGASFTPAKAGDHYNQPIYIYKAASGMQYYTYDIDTGNVDTSKEEKTSIYYDNTEGWGEVWVHAYNAIGQDWDEKLSIDNSDSDTSYYKFEFNAGKYCYFVFYDKTDNSDYTLAEKKTPVLYFTGQENDNREYQILARGTNSSLDWYLHPKTKAWNAYLDLYAAYAATTIPDHYTYNATNGEYNAVGSIKMGGLQSQMNNAKSYAESGPWSVSGAANYSDLAAAAVEFANAISDARIYVSEEIPDSVKTAATDTAYEGSGGIYKEGSYKDDIVAYETRWVNALANAYNDAMTLYSGGSPSAAILREKAAQIKALVNAPETTLNSNAIQIIVNDQKGKDADGNITGQWGKSNIHFYCLDGGVWNEIKLDLYDTTQSNEGYYAYLFRSSALPSNRIKIAKSMPEIDDPGDSVSAGTRYIFYTSTNTLEVDKSVLTITCTTNEISSGTASEPYREFSVAPSVDEFVIYFNNDTMVNGDGQTYTIYAGAYTISKRTYRNFTTDVAGRNGINLFTAEAKTFFTTPGRYGMSSATGYDASAWGSDKIDTANNIDIMVKSVANTGSGEISAKTGSSNTVAFRYNGERGSDTLTLSQNIDIEGGIVSIAANNITIPSNWDFTIEAKTVIFYTDTTITVTSPSGAVIREARIAHGTYVFNESASSTTAEISLKSTGSDPDWRDLYTLVDEVQAGLRGGEGKYVVKN